MIAFNDNMLALERVDFNDFNNRILFMGRISKFWECEYCGNATPNQPVICEKCYSGSFVFVNFRGRLVG